MVMREKIQFRILRKKDNQMIDFLDLDNDEIYDILSLFSGDTSYINDYIIMEFIVNKDEQDIYEDDIIEKFKNGKKINSFLISDIKNFRNAHEEFKDIYELKVVGNKYQNPELNDSVQVY
eukprot:GHVO01059595.1.p1 GENE.GHVO01059595.1~~GHVO01059595.1.p1  ORF type:complete len:120 (-),score=15.48 GHVO01059595.1:29-388(-)